MDDIHVGEWMGQTSCMADEYYLQQAVIGDNPIDYMYKAVIDEA